MDFRLYIARRYLLSPRRVSLISVITGISVAGISLGVALLIIVLSVMNGFYDVVRNLLVSFDPHVRIIAVDAQGIDDADSLMTVALELTHVAHAASYVEGKALFTHQGAGNVNKVVIVRGVDAATMGGLSRVADHVAFGQFDLERRENLPGLVIGMSLGSRLALFPGMGERPASEVALLSAAGVERMLMQRFGPPPITLFEVRGLYELDMIFDESHVFIDLAEAQRLFRMGDRVTGVELRLAHLDRATGVKAELQRRLDPERYQVMTWYDLQQSLYDVMRLEKWGASMILALIIMVAAFNIIGSLTMVVIEKRRDLGVLQAMGVSRKNIKKIFVYEGLLIGGFGCLIGLFLGLGLSYLQQIYQFVPLASADSFIIDAYPVAVQPLDLLLVLGITLMLCTLAALYPAARAAAIDPARAVQDDM